MITLLNMIFANPIAYLIFPNMVNSYNATTTTEYAVYSGYLNLYKDNKLVKQFTGTSTIDLSDQSGRIRFENVTDTYSAVVGEWDLAKSKEQIMKDNIKEAMVLWYDIKRQGADNENMSANPILKDLSGNGHDATCYNFAWSGMSGIGGYGITFHINDNIVGDDASGYVRKLNSNTVLFIKSGIGAANLVYSLGVNAPRTLNVKITGITGTGISVKWQGGNYGNVVIANTDGIWELSCDPEQPDNTSVGLKVFSEEPKDCNVTIELIPQYPNGLVFDRIDDYAITYNIPYFKVNTGFTVICEREWFNGIEGNIYSSILLSKRSNLANQFVDGEFTIEKGSVENNTSFSVHSFNKASTNIQKAFEKDKALIYCTSTSYNGKINLTKNSDFEWETDLLSIGWKGLGEGVSDANELFSGVLYKLIVFNRDLTEDEIEWVKTNLIEGDTEL